VRSIQELERLATELRLHIMNMMGANKAHHFGGSLSAADLMTGIYFHGMRYDPQNPTWPERDRFVMSKGHCVPAQYAALAMLGVFPLAELATLKQLGTRLQGHPAAHLLPGIEACTGSLGQGLSFANGMALAGRMQQRDYRLYCLMGDGETHEGQVWEAARTTAQQRLHNVTAIIDRNGLKAMDSSYAAADLGHLAGRWAALGWAVREIDGHNMAEIVTALDWARAEDQAPCVILAATVKGRGVSFLEGQAQYHNAALSPEQLAAAIAELEAPVTRGAKEQAQ
jgi:transketolase